MKSRASLGLFTFFMVILILVTTKLQYEHMKIENRWRPFGSIRGVDRRLKFLGSLPRGIVESTSDLELKPLRHNPRFKGRSVNYTALLAIPVGIKQKQNVDIIAQKFLVGNCSIILFHYDGNVDGWNDLEWSNKAIHVVAYNQTKWFLQIMVSEGLEISQPALDPDLSEIHHRITVRIKTGKVHWRVYESRGSLNCSDDSTEPPCTGWVEGMAPVFSRAAWRCVWHLIQNDLIHGWGLDMKLGYCAQGDRTKKVGVIDSEYVIHQGIPTLGGPSARLRIKLTGRTTRRRILGGIIAF